MINKNKTYACARIMMIACVMLVQNITGFAQAPSPELLKQQLKSSPADTQKVNLLLKLSGYYNGIAKPTPADLGSAINYANQAGKLSTSLMFAKGLGNSYMQLAHSYEIKQDSANCKGNVYKAIAVFLKNNLKRDAAESYLKLEEYYQFFKGTDFNVRIAYYEQALPLFKQAGATARQAATLGILGDFYQVKGQYSKSLEDLHLALTLYKSINYNDLEGLYDLLGTVYNVSGDFNQAVKYGLLGIREAERLKDTSINLCPLYNRVGMTYYKMKIYDKAYAYYKKSLAVALKYKDTSSIINENVNLSTIYTGTGRPAESIRMLTTAFKNYPPQDLSSKAAYSVVFLKSYFSLKQFDNARPYSQKLEQYSAGMDPNTGLQQVIHQVLSDYYVVTLQDVPARRELAQLQRIATVHHNRLATASAYQLEARLDSAEGKYADALKSYKKYGIVKDSVFNETQSRQISQLQVEYETEKKDQSLKIKENRIHLLSNQARLQQANLRQEKLTQRLTICAAVLLAILLGFTINGYRQKQRTNRKLQAQRLEIEEKNNSLIQLVQEKDGLLEEKEWLMKEIHHRVKNNLQIVISLLNTQSTYLHNDIAYNAIRESQHRMQSISLIHQKLYQSENLALVDIKSYICDLVDYLKESFDTGTRIEFEADIAAIELDVTRAVPLGLILNEAITNAIKYAFPDGRKGYINISLGPADEHSFTLKIQDNGIGFHKPTDISKSKSLGMSLMRGLSKQLGGSLTVESHEGTSIEVNFVDEKLLKAV
ncbi:tetratricopeptide repeat-containing sensor histidine kinase [Mucilaginibacter flavus]|uniref:tetratricopeptide repeat-containing sensor histidine kinase n=1 Tax=Mucilaginibacter flavus TaxID=931504 RepID=UPI0025B2B88D|nr:histidine kinase dimerization/phosphoacceptor domain -containing protein [Mucilaginibacter flavus]MDN3582393.1 histidine kinase dimerization/phosphoacceptor domain -containing protein [Mucilaginibacter flavus]